MSDPNPSPDGRPFPQLGSYKIVRQLGSGGMSNVFQAIHEGTSSIVALKVLPRKLAQNAVLLQRFLREARSAENLDHPSIVAIYDRGFDQGRHYLVLEYVEGSDLYDRVKSGGPLGPAEAVEFIRQVALGLDYAAKQGMIHRDIKPANLLMTPDGQAKIIDLGLALQADEEDERVTRDGTTVGTVDYMSPEQARDSRKINERSDIYSLGCTCHYLLTGSPPYPGGTLADKLARHHSAPIPDVRDRNPAVPADLAALVRKMMAKKPADRFVDYPDLVAGLARIGAAPGATVDLPLPLPDVLIDDEDDSDDAIELTLAGPASPAPPARDKPRPPATAPEISLADLAALDDDPPAASARRRGLALPPASAPASSVVLDALLDPSDADQPAVAPRGRGDELPLQTWIAAGVGVGLLIAVVAFGVRFALSVLAPPAPEPVVAQPEPDRPDEATGPATPDTSPAGGVRPGPVAPPPRPPAGPYEMVGPPRPAAPPRGPRRAEVEPTYPDALLARLGFAAARPPAPIEATGKVAVSRLADPADPNQTTSLAAAFGRANDEVEIVDAGPFHEDDCQVAGKARVVRGRPGLRPTLMVQASRQPLVNEQAAKFLLGGAGVERLLLEGIDLVVDLRDLPPTQASLFLCQGVEVTIRDCTITVVNAEDRRGGFALLKLVGGPRPNRIRFERSLVRGPVETFIQVAGGAAAIALDRTVVSGANGPLFQVDPANPGERSLSFSRSVLATRGPLINWGGKPAATTLRALGCTFGRVESSGTAPLLVARGEPAGNPKGWLDYDGEANHWDGWQGFGQWGPTPPAAGSLLAGLRQSRPEADRDARESSAAWPVVAIDEGMTADVLADLAPESAATLALVAAPRPELLGMTVELFRRLPAPELRDDLGSIPAAGGRPATDLTFDAGPADLGLFLKEKVTDPGRSYVVRIQGTGSRPMTPVRLPDGASVTILGPAGTGPGVAIPTFVAARGGPALIELHGGDLTLANLAFAAEGANRPRHWIRVEDGLLGVRRCSYRDAGGDAAAGAAALAIVARGPGPTPPRPGPFRGPAERPAAQLEDCWIWTGGDAVAAEVARGVVGLKNCLIVAGPAACRLKAAADRPEADLVLENCSIADDHFGVELEAPAVPPAPAARPWLVVSRSSVFPRNWRDGGALLGVDPASFARGALFWQSSNDIYEVARFIAPGGAGAAAPGGSADVVRQWLDVWGAIHARGDVGPNPRRLDKILHFRDKDRARATRFTPPQLELDPKLHAGQGVNFKNLPPLPKS